jgi:hypothetical protein
MCQKSLKKHYIKIKMPMDFRVILSLPWPIKVLGLTTCWKFRTMDIKSFLREGKKTPIMQAHIFLSSPFFLYTYDTLFTLLRNNLAVICKQVTTQC